MPVYEQHYRLWTGQPQPRWLRWSVITRYHVRQLFSGKGRVGLVILLVISGAIHLGFLSVIYGLSNEELLASFGIPTERLWKVNAKFFLGAFLPQSILVALLALIVGSGLIAEDRRDNAIPLYLSRPLTPVEYLLGKFGVLAAFILGITAVPINLLFVLEVAIHGGWEFFRQYWWLPLSITFYSLLITALTGAVILMASSLVNKSALAGVLVIGLFIGHHVLASAIAIGFGNLKLLVFSLQLDMVRVGLWLFGIEIEGIGPLSMSGHSATLIILAVTAACLAIVWRRIRPVEVVK